jgi:hypothetical protein
MTRKSMFWAIGIVPTHGWYNPDQLVPHWFICVHPFLIRVKILITGQSLPFGPAKEFNADKKGMNANAFEQLFRSEEIPIGPELPASQ